LFKEEHWHPSWSYDKIYTYTSSFEYMARTMSQLLTKGSQNQTNHRDPRNNNRNNIRLAKNNNKSKHQK